MPSFLSKVFGRKKDEKDPPRQGRVSDASLLEGKFETLSPSATQYPELPNGKGLGKEKDTGFTLFRAKSRQAPPEPSVKRVEIPQLSLRLPSQREVFETESDDQKSLADSVIGDRRLNPVEALTLIRACSQAITARGLETLGIMHPHWYSASSDIQRRLISLFIQSLAPKSPISTLSPTASPFVSAFQSEISSARSPHDVAAVLRWGLRHLRLEGGAFGHDDEWYKNFFDAERSSECPSTAFSTQLAPQLPGPHLELLVATLEILSLLAAHAEANGISGSKLSKFFGLWLLTAQRAEGEDNWSTFYARWERMGRILEHLFLSRIRDEADNARMPTRLLELVHQYPYTRTATPSFENDLLPRPRFSTRQYDALFVRIETEISASSVKPRPHPLRLLEEAFSAEASANDDSDHADLWASIKKAVADQTNPSPGGYPALSHIFADETIRFLSLLPMEDDKEPLSPPFNLIIPKKSAANGKRSVSDPLASPSSPSASQYTVPATDLASSTLPSAITPSLSARSTDWAEFSASGFFEATTVNTPLAATLLGTDKDAGVSASSATTGRRSRLVPVSPISIHVNGRKSLDGSRTPTIAVNGTKLEKFVSRASLVSHIQLDEAFIDFWADALPDPISANWPAFVICKLKEGVNGLDLSRDGGKRVDWLVVEQVFKRPVTASVQANGATNGDGRRPRPASPKSSVRSETTLHSMRKRLSLWNAGRASTDKATGKGKEKTAGAQKVGEMGEILKEEDENEATVRLGVPPLKARPKTLVEVKRNGLDATDKSAGTRRKSAESKVNGNTAVGSGISGLSAGAVAVKAVPKTAAEKSADSEPAVSPWALPVAPPAPIVLEEFAAVPDITVPKTAKQLVTIPAADSIKVAHTGTSHQGIKDNAIEEQADVPVIHIDSTPAAEQTEADVTIAVETVKPASFSSASSIASPVLAHIQPNVVASAPEPAEVMVHPEALHVNEDRAEDGGAVQDAVPVVDVEPTSTEPAGEGVSNFVQHVSRPAEPSVKAKPEAEELPPAPESVVLSGETPGPTVALSTSEPAALALAAVAAEDEDKADEPELTHPGSNVSTTLVDSHPVPCAAEPSVVVIEPVGSTPESDPVMESSPTAPEDSSAQTEPQPETNAFTPTADDSSSSSGPVPPTHATMPPAPN